jgi:chloramphenicol O-acetyltransferase
MHVSAEQVHTKLDSKLLKQLLELEQQDKVKEFKSRMQKETAASKADAEAGSSENWQSLMSSAPWLEQQQLEQQQQQQQQHDQQVAEQQSQSSGRY